LGLHPGYDAVVKHEYWPRISRMNADRAG